MLGFNKDKDEAEIDRLRKVRMLCLHTVLSCELGVMTKAGDRHGTGLGSRQERARTAAAGENYISYRC